MWDDLQDASFRNVPFYLATVDGKSGRRAIAHQYPRREKGFVEDNGAAMWQFNVQGMLVGLNYRQQLDQLLNALNTPGSGKLVHPHFGEMLVQVGNVSHKLSTQQGGYASVSFECFKADGIALPVQADATEDVLEDEVNLAIGQCQVDFEADWMSDLLPDFSLSDLTDTVHGYINDVTEFIRQLPDVPGMMSDVLDEAERLKYAVGNLLAIPGKLGRELTNLLARTEDLVTTPPQALRVYDQLHRRFEGKAAAMRAKKHPFPGALPGTTGPVPGSIAEQEQACHTAISNLMVAQVSLLSAGTLPATQFTDAKLAQETAARLDARLQAISHEVLARGQRDSAQALRQCAVALRTDIHHRALLLPQVRTLTTERTESLLLLAYRETGNARLRDAMVSRNRPVHPGFVMPGTRVEWLHE